MTSREYHRKWARQNRDKRNRLNREFGSRQKALIDSLKSRPCADCGIQYAPHIMQFDHLGDKSFSLASARRRAKSKILEEAAKCEVVCANCHADRTHRRRQVALVSTA